MLIGFSYFVNGGKSAAIGDIVRFLIFTDVVEGDRLDLDAPSNDIADLALPPLVFSFRSIQMGCLVGHAYYFAQDIWPLELGSQGKGLLETPRLLSVVLCVLIVQCLGDELETDHVFGSLSDL